MTSRRDAVPFDAHHFEKLAPLGVRPPAEAIFRDIYRRNHWGGTISPSGQGASPNQTDQLRRALPALLRRLAVDTLLDLPCGDYSWMRLVDLPTVSYIGADLLSEVIQPLQTAYTDSRHRFLVLDLTRDPLPQADLIFCRDCLVHLSFADIQRALANAVRSGIPHLMTTTFPECEVNEDIVTGDWRPLNLERTPFHFPRPLELLSEGCTEGGGLFADKSLGVWRTDALIGLSFLSVDSSGGHLPSTVPLSWATVPAETLAEGREQWQHTLMKDTTGKKAGGC